MVAEPAPGRYAMHDLLRGYAADLARTEDGQDECRLAGQRLLEHYVHTAQAAALRLAPNQDRLPLPAPHTGVTVENLDDERAAEAWFAAEEAVLLALVGYAGDAGWTCTPAGSHTPWCLLDRRGRWHEMARVQQAALAAAERQTDPLELARARRGLARASGRLGHNRQAWPTWTAPSGCTGQSGTAPARPRSTSTSRSCTASSAAGKTPSATAGRPYGCSPMSVEYAPSFVPASAMGTPVSDCRACGIGMSAPVLLSRDAPRSSPFTEKV
jgi:hypothetical protein